MDSVGKEYWMAKLDEHRDMRERLLSNKLQELNVGGLLHSGHASIALFEAALEFNGNLILNWISIFQGSWLRQETNIPEELAKKDSDELKVIILEEEVRINSEISVIAKRFNWDDNELKAGKEQLQKSCAVSLNQGLSEIELLKQRRVKEIQREEAKEQRERVNRRKDIAQSLLVAVISSVIGVFLADYFNGKQLKLYQGMVNGMTQELSDLKKENQSLVKWILKTPEEIDREIDRAKEDAQKLKITLKEQYTLKKAEYKSRMGERGVTPQSSPYIQGLKNLESEETEKLTGINVELNRKIEDLLEEKKKLSRNN